MEGASIVAEGTWHLQGHHLLLTEEKACSESKVLPSFEGSLQVITAMSGSHLAPCLPPTQHSSLFILGLRVRTQKGFLLWPCKALSHKVAQIELGMVFPELM